jgi:hypothetical protein
MATQDIWDVNGTGGWTAAGDWSTGSVPAIGDDVTIGSNGQAAFVKSASDVIIHTLAITSRDWLELTGGNFDVTDGLPFGMFGFIEVDNANFEIAGGTINNSATIDLMPSGDITTDLTIYNTVQLNGAGSILFAGNGNDGILGGTPSATLTNFDNNISGSGFIEGLVFINRSTVETNNDLGAGTLRIVGSADGGSFDNEGSVYADNGGTLLFGVPTGSTASTIINNQLIELRASSAATYLEISNNITITGTGQILLGGGTTNGDFIVSNGHAATLNLNGGLLSGVGQVGDGNLTLNIESGTTVEPTGISLIVNTGSNTVTNSGLMKSDGGSTGDTVLDIKSPLQNNGNVLSVNDGLVLIEDGGTNAPTGVIQVLGSGSGIIFVASFNNGGLIQVANGGQIIVNSSIESLNGGQIEIGSGGLLDLQGRPQGGGGTVSGGVEFTGAGGTLQLDQNSGQIGTDISGLTAGDSIDLTFLSFATGDHAVWTQGSGGEGMITIEDADNSPLAPLVVEGSWNSQDFTVTADDVGGTLVTLQGAPSYVEHAGNNDEWVLNDGQWAGSAGPGSHPSGYNVAGIGDWTGSGTDGILWFDPTTGDTDEWQLSNTQWSASVDLGTHPGNYQISGVGDFNGDGTSDVLWTSTSGGSVQTDIWELGSSGKWANSVSPGSHPAGYTVAGIGDWTGNGTDGILWYNPSTGDTDEWQLVNGRWAASVDLGSHPGNYQISGIGDFNGDGTDDVLWTGVNGNGTVSTDIWELGANGQWINSVSPGTHPAGYQVAGVGDLAGTSTSDILWYNASTGDTDEWLINKGQWAGSVDLGTHPGTAQIAGVGDFTGNGTESVLWHAST